MASMKCAAAVRIDCAASLTQLPQAAAALPVLHRPQGVWFSSAACPAQQCACLDLLTRLRHDLTVVC
jgi:hypothetical protein